MNQTRAQKILKITLNFHISKAPTLRLLFGKGFLSFLNWEREEAWI